MYKHRSTTGSGLSLVKHALLGYQHAFPRLRGKLSTSWENVRTWEEQRSTRLWPPLPVPLWLFTIGLARAHAEVERKASMQYQWQVLSVLLEVGFLCITTSFRTGKAGACRRVPARVFYFMLRPCSN